jgi:hypothetical protein
MVSDLVGVVGVVWSEPGVLLEAGGLDMVAGAAMCLSRMCACISVR